MVGGIGSGGGPLGEREAGLGGIGGGSEPGMKAGPPNDRLGLDGAGRQADEGRCGSVQRSIEAGARRASSRSR